MRPPRCVAQGGRGIWRSQDESAFRWCRIGRRVERVRVKVSWRVVVSWDVGESGTFAGGCIIGFGNYIIIGVDKK
jgi:hypothetical protein